MENAEYQTYLASREWAVLRERVRNRSGGFCERCRARRMGAVHHKTYERIGRERLDDLLAICNPCHEYLSAKRATDPIEVNELRMAAVRYADLDGSAAAAAQLVIANRPKKS